MRTKILPMHKIPLAKSPKLGDIVCVADDTATGRLAETAGRRDKMLTIHSNKGTAIVVTADDKGFVTATVNGTQYQGTTQANGTKNGVQMFGSKKGDYLQIADGIAALIATADLRAATTFFADAKVQAQRASRAAAKAEHDAKMQDPDYARAYRIEWLSADMDRANSNN